ncbi:MAG: hypothetical protein ACFE9Q_06885 [Candidatus Hodarchaeota archaeon]
MSLNRFGAKIQATLDKYFHKIFNNSHFLYTIIFLLSSLLISLLSLIPNQIVGNLILFLATVLAITFILLMVEGLIPQLNNYLFGIEKRFDKWKLICFTINFFIGFFIVLPYFLVGTSSKLTIQFLGWDVILPAIFIIIYFGWNLVQIFFLRRGFDDVSDKLHDKIIDKYGVSKKKELICLLFLILALIVPILIELGTFFGFLPEFSSVGEGARTLFIASSLVVLIILIITSWRLITLYQRSKKISSTNAYSSMFYILIWILLWFRSFSFFNSLLNITQAQTQPDIVSGLIDILLLVFTAIMVLRGLGEKVYDSILFNSNNMPFFLFAFTVLYIEGQIIMITGAGSLTGVLADRNQINLINNFLIILITVIFYWWYSEHSLERKGFLIRKRYYPEDVALVLKEFNEYLVDKRFLDKEKVGIEELQNFLVMKNIKIHEEKPEDTESKIKVEETQE